LLDRIDLHIEVTPVPFKELSSTRVSETSVDIRKRVIDAREVQKIRFENEEGTYNNAQMSAKQLRSYCQIDEAGSQLLNSAMERMGLSARAYDRILKVSRTIADLAGQPSIEADHLAEAIQYRSLDREGWAG
jgi:magnesium chelatase family protein